MANTSQPYTTGPNDTAYSIAQQITGNGMRGVDLFAANPGVNINNLSSGTKLTLPASWFNPSSSTPSSNSNTPTTISSSGAIVPGYGPPSPQGQATLNTFVKNMPLVSKPTPSTINSTMVQNGAGIENPSIIPAAQNEIQNNQQQLIQKNTPATTPSINANTITPNNQYAPTSVQAIMQQYGLTNLPTNNVAPIVGMPDTSGITASQNQEGQYLNQVGQTIDGLNKTLQGDVQSQIDALNTESSTVQTEATNTQNYLQTVYNQIGTTGQDQVNTIISEANAADSQINADAQINQQNFTAQMQETMANLEGSLKANGYSNTDPFTLSQIAVSKQPYLAKLEQLNADTAAQIGAVAAQANGDVLSSQDQTKQQLAQVGYQISQVMPEATKQIAVINAQIAQINYQATSQQISNEVAQEQLVQAFYDKQQAMQLSIAQLSAQISGENAQLQVQTQANNINAIKANNQVATDVSQIQQTNLKAQSTPVATVHTPYGDLQLNVYGQPINNLGKYSNVPVIGGLLNMLQGNNPMSYVNINKNGQAQLSYGGQNYNVTFNGSYQ